MSTVCLYTNQPRRGAVNASLFPYLSLQLRWMRNPMESLDETEEIKKSWQAAAQLRLAASRASRRKKVFNYCTAAP